MNRDSCVCLNVLIEAVDGGGTGFQHYAGRVRSSLKPLRRVPAALVVLRCCVSRVEKYWNKQQHHHQKCSIPKRHLYCPHSPRREEGEYVALPAQGEIAQRVPRGACVAVRFQWLIAVLGFTRPSSSPAQ